VAREIKAAGINEVRGGAQWWGAAYRLVTNFIELSHCAMFSRRMRRLLEVKIKDSSVRMSRVASNARHQNVKSPSITHVLRTFS
jgi:hypothetical protein